MLLNILVHFSECDCQCQLFKAVIDFNSPHCLHHLLPPVRKVPYVLRDQGHFYELIEHMRGDQKVLQLGYKKLTYYITPGVYALKI